MSPGRSKADRNIREIRDLDRLSFWENGLLPVVTQDAETGTVLMVAFSNREALEKTIETGEMHFWSRSRQEIWHKGATSGNYLTLVSLHDDCDGDTILARVRPKGPACHTGDRSCFGNLKAEEPFVPGDGGAVPSGAPPLPEDTLPELWAVMLKRAEERPEGSYTVRLLQDENFRLKKLGEETVELVLALAAKEKGRIAEEGADLVYHLLAALLGADVGLEDLLSALEKRKR